MANASDKAGILLFSNITWIHVSRHFQHSDTQIPPTANITQWEPRIEIKKAGNGLKSVSLSDAFLSTFHVSSTNGSCPSEPQPKMASQSRGRLWALPGSQGLSGVPACSQPTPPQAALGSQSRAHTPLSWRAAATARATCAAPSTSIPPSAWARARETSLTGVSNPSSSFGPRPPAPSDASPRKEHPAAASAAAAAAAFQHDENADALRVAVERVAKDVARVAEEAIACRLANERALTEMASEVERLTRVIADNVKEDGRRSREVVKAVAAQTAGEMKELSASVHDALAALSEVTKTPRRETVVPEDARRSLYLQMRNLASEELLQTSLRCDHGGDASCEEAHVRRSDAGDRDERRDSKTIPTSAPANPDRSSRHGDPETVSRTRVPLATLSRLNSEPVASPLVPRQLGTRQSTAWPQVSEYRMPVPVLGQESIASGEFEDKGITDRCSDEVDGDDDDDVFLHDGPLEVQSEAKEHRDIDDGTIAPWEIAVRRDWKPAAIESPTCAKTGENAKKPRVGSKTGRPSPRVQIAGRQIGRRRSTRRRSK